jgi:excisionase family DNA binding protein
MPPPRLPAEETYLTVAQAAEYLHLNEKKLYALIQEDRIPATRTTGKWLFPRRLVDEWLLETAHGGALSDRLIVSGSDDPLLAFAISLLCVEAGEQALVAYSPCGTRTGLTQLAGRRASVAAIHWGPAKDSARNHTQLVAAYPGHEQWAIVGMALREQGVLLRPGVTGVGRREDLGRAGLRWVMRRDGAGSQRFFEQIVPQRGSELNVVAKAQTERHAASLLRQGDGDCAPGARAAASEFGLEFLSLGEEAFDLVLPRPIYFRSLFQRLLDTLASAPARAFAARLQGYDLSPLGRLRPESTT